MRLGTANAFDSTLANLTTRQAGLADMQEKLSAGKRVVRASDDPVGAAQSERAMNRTERIETEKRALNIQRNAVTMAESTLGDATSALQTLRELIISANDGGYVELNRTSIAGQMRNLRDQLFNYANQQDSNGIPLFGGLGSLSDPFTDVITGVTFQGLPGQRASTAVTIPSVMDGQAVWMNVPTGNGVYNIGLGGANSGTLWTDTGMVLAATAATNYSITFTVDPATQATTYDVVDNTPPGGTIVTGAPYVDGQSIQFGGLSFLAHGTPANGDTLQITPSTKTSLFTVLDAAIKSIDGSKSDAPLAHAVALALTQIDAGMERIQSARGVAGDLLNRADRIESRQEGKLEQLASDRSRAEDMDMVKGISQFQNQQTAYDVALKTYAQVQRLSLFNYIG